MNSDVETGKPSERASDICSTGKHSCRLNLSEDDGFGVDGHILGGVVSLVDANETVGHFKHVVPQGDDDELSILGLFLK